MNTVSITNRIIFPEFKGIKCNMMPFIQGDPTSLPKEYQSYADIINNNFLEKGEIGYLTIDEKFVECGTSQRGFNDLGINRNVHVEVGHLNGKNRWGGSGWGGRANTLLEDSTMVLIANNISNTCKVWDNVDRRYTSNGDLSQYIYDYPETSGLLLQSGEVAKISIFTPHECINQTYSSNRQFFRIVGKGVTGREDYFTVNPLLN